MEALSHWRWVNLQWVLKLCQWLLSHTNQSLCSTAKFCIASEAMPLEADVESSCKDPSLASESVRVVKILFLWLFGIQQERAGHHIVTQDSRR